MDHTATTPICKCEPFWGRAWCRAGSEQHSRCPLKQACCRLHSTRALSQGQCGLFYRQKRNNLWCEYTKASLRQQLKAVTLPLLVAGFATAQAGSPSSQAATKNGRLGFHANFWHFFERFTGGADVASPCNCGCEKATKLKRQPATPLEGRLT